MEKTQSRTALDVCCGTGRGVRALLASGYDAKGLDFSPHLLEVGVRELGIPADRLQQGDATLLPYPDNSFDVSCILGALHHTAQPMQMISEMIRVTRNAIIVSDELNRLAGGVKQVLVHLGMFDFLYTTIFRRPPRRRKRSSISDTDGPTYVFSCEEVIPLLKQHFRDFRCLTFYRFGKLLFYSYKFPRLFATAGVITMVGKKILPGS
jgi:SAM-dependent methyltransferase